MNIQDQVMLRLIIRKVGVEEKAAEKANERRIGVAEAQALIV
jgi:hypothetical protein